MNQNRLYLLIGALAVAVVGMGVYIYQEQNKPEGVEIRINEKGISVDGN